MDYPSIQLYFLVYIILANGHWAYQENTSQNWDI